MIFGSIHRKLELSMKKPHILKYQIKRTKKVCVYSSNPVFYRKSFLPIKNWILEKLDFCVKICHLQKWQIFLI